MNNRTYFLLSVIALTSIHSISAMNESDQKEIQRLNKKIGAMAARRAYNFSLQNYYYSAGDSLEQLEKCTSGNPSACNDLRETVKRYHRRESSLAVATEKMVRDHQGP